jgi:hypothetical protein
VRGGFRVREKRARGGAGGHFEGHGSSVVRGRGERGALWARPCERGRRKERGAWRDGGRQQPPAIGRGWCHVAQTGEPGGLTGGPGWHSAGFE